MKKILNTTFKIQPLNFKYQKGINKFIKGNSELKGNKQVKTNNFEFENAVGSSIRKLEEWAKKRREIQESTPV